MTLRVWGRMPQIPPMEALGIAAIAGAPAPGVAKLNSSVASALMAVAPPFDPLNFETARCVVEAGNSVFAPEATMNTRGALPVPDAGMDASPPYPMPCRRDRGACTMAAVCGSIAGIPGMEGAAPAVVGEATLSARPTVGAAGAGPACVSAAEVVGGGPAGAAGADV